jgi:Domain of unknown function (DUF1905)
LEFTFSGTVFEWRGPAPYQFVAVPEAEAELLRDMLTALTYGWGMIPVRGWIGETEFTTSMWPRNGGYVLPLKVAVRRAERIDLDDDITVRLEVDV